jgi:hypothetical protein
VKPSYLDDSPVKIKQTDRDTDTGINNSSKAFGYKTAASRLSATSSSSSSSSSSVNSHKESKKGSILNQLKQLPEFHQISKSLPGVKRPIPSTHKPLQQQQQVKKPIANVRNNQTHSLSSQQQNHRQSNEQNDLIPSKNISNDNSANKTNIHSTNNGNNNYNTIDIISDKQHISSDNGISIHNNSKNSNNFKANDTSSNEGKAHNDQHNPIYNKDLLCNLAIAIPYPTTAAVISAIDSSDNTNNITSKRAFSAALGINGVSTYVRADNISGSISSSSTGIEASNSGVASSTMSDIGNNQYDDREKTTIQSTSFEESSTIEPSIEYSQGLSSTRYSTASFIEPPREQRTEAPSTSYLSLIISNTTEKNVANHLPIPQSQVAPTNPHSNPTNPHSNSTNPHSNPTNPHFNPTNPHSNPTNPHSNPTNPHSNPTNPHFNPTNPHSSPINPHFNPTTPHSIPNRNLNTVINDPPVPPTSLNSNININNTVIDGSILPPPTYECKLVPNPNNNLKLVVPDDSIAVPQVSTTKPLLTSADTLPPPLTDPINKYTSAPHECASASSRFLSSLSSSITNHTNTTKVSETSTKSKDSLMSNSNPTIDPYPGRINNVVNNDNFVRQNMNNR